MKKICPKCGVAWEGYPDQSPDSHSCSKHGNVEKTMLDLIGKDAETYANLPFDNPVRRFFEGYNYAKNEIRNRLEICNRLKRLRGGK